MARRAADPGHRRRRARRGRACGRSTAPDRARGADDRADRAAAPLLRDARPDRPVVEARARREQARVPAVVDPARDPAAADPGAARLPPPGAGVPRRDHAAWPLAVLVLFLLSATALGATPLHAFQGITIPLAGARRPGRSERRRLAAAAAAAGSIAARAVALVTIPQRVFELNNAADTVAPQPDNATFIPGDERDALHYLAARQDARRRAHPQLPRRGRSRQDRPPDVRRRLPVVGAALLRAGPRRAGAVRRRDDARARRARSSSRPAPRSCSRTARRRQTSPSCSAR